MGYKQQASIHLPSPPPLLSRTIAQFPGGEPLWDSYTNKTDGDGLCKGRVREPQNRTVRGVVCPDYHSMSCYGVIL